MGNASFSDRAYAVFRALSQDELWVDADGIIHYIEEMDPVHRRNCINFLLARAEHLEVYYSYGEMEYIGIPDGEIAAVDAELALDETWRERTDDPQAWLKTTPLLRALTAAQDEWERDGDFLTL